MTANIWKVGTNNAFSTTLNGGITDTDTTINLTTTTGLQAPGVITVDRVDANNTATPTTREYISFTGIDGNAINGCTRGLGGSTAQAHSSGAKIEETFTVTHWGDFLDTFAVSHDSSGNVVVSSASIVTLNNTRISNVSLTSQDVTITNSLNISGASLTGNFPLTPVWVIAGNVSGPTTSVGPSITMPQAGVWDWFSLTLKNPASSASLMVDINKNGTSIMGSLLPVILPNGTYISTASIGTLSFSAGDTFTIDIDAGGGLGSDLSIMGRAR